MNTLTRTAITVLRHELAIMSIVAALLGIGMGANGLSRIYQYEHHATIHASGWRKICTHENKVVVCREVRR